MKNEISFASIIYTFFLVSCESTALFDELKATKSCCYVASFDEKVEGKIYSRQPREYLRESDLPTVFDWRNVNGTNFCSKVLTQMAPSVCGSCWAEAATGNMYK